MFVGFRRVCDHLARTASRSDGEYVCVHVWRGMSARLLAHAPTRTCARRVLCVRVRAPSSAVLCVFVCVYVCMCVCVCMYVLLLLLIY